MLVQLFIFVIQIEQTLNKRYVVYIVEEGILRSPGHIIPNSSVIAYEHVVIIRILYLIYPAPIDK